jgi:hypothetical protein
LPGASYRTGRFPDRWNHPAAIRGGYAAARAEFFRIILPAFRNREIFFPLDAGEAANPGDCAAELIGHLPRGIEEADATRGKADDGAAIGVFADVVLRRDPRQKFIAQKSDITISYGAVFCTAHGVFESAMPPIGIGLAQSGRSGCRCAGYVARVNALDPVSATGPGVLHISLSEQIPKDGSSGETCCGFSPVLTQTLQTVASGRDRPTLSFCQQSFAATFKAYWGAWLAAGAGGGWLLSGPL